MGSGAKSYMRKGFLIYEEIRTYFIIYEKAVSHIWLCTRDPLWLSLYMIKTLFSFLSVQLSMPSSNIKNDEGQSPECRKEIQFYSNFYLSRVHPSFWREKSTVFKAFVVEVLMKGGGGGGGGGGEGNGLNSPRRDLSWREDSHVGHHFAHFKRRYGFFYLCLL